MKFLEPPGWPRPKGYSNGIVARGEMVFLAGIIGWNAQEQFEGADFAGQARQCFANIADLLAEAGAKPEHVVRLTWYVNDRAEYRAAGKPQKPFCPSPSTAVPETTLSPTTCYWWIICAKGLA
jgi:enamine deaminase RidA (YjgF/YER057c/UK114 family)